MNGCEIYEFVKKCKNLEEQVNVILGVVEPLKYQDIVAYLLKETLNSVKTVPDLHFNLLTKLPREVVSKFHPGLLSTYFRILKDSKVQNALRKAVIGAVGHVLSNSVFDEASKRNVYNFFYFNRNCEFEKIYALCVQKFEGLHRAFFVSELIVLGYKATEEEYALVNGNICEVFSPKLLRKLLECGEYIHNEDIFRKLVSMYRAGDAVKDIVFGIQQRYRVNDRVLELCVSNERTVCELLPENDLQKFEVLAQYAKEIPFCAEVMKKYLELSQSPDDVLTSVFGRKFCARDIISNNYDELLEYAFDRMDGNMNVVLNLIGIEFRPKIDELVMKSIKLVSECSSVEKLGRHLWFFKVVLGKNCLRRSILRRLFEGIVYLDHCDGRIRCAKYDIFCDLFLQYALMDLVIECEQQNSNEECIPHVRINNAFHIDAGSCLCAFESMATCNCSVSGISTVNLLSIRERVDTRDIDKDNVKVLASTLWDELNTMPGDSELAVISSLLKRIIDLTGRFYESRMTRSGFIHSLIEQYRIERFCETRRGKTKKFFYLMESMVEKFHLSKDVFESMFSLSLDYFHVLNTEKLMRSMIEKDRYHCLYIFHKIIAKTEKRLSDDVRTFLKSRLREVANIFYAES